MCAFVNEAKNLRSPTSLFVQTCKKYNVYDILKQCVLTGEYMSLHEWKKKVSQIVNLKDYRNILLQCGLYKVLNYFNFNCNVNSVKTWWRLAYVNPRTTYFVKTMVRVLLNVSCLGFHACKYCGYETIDSLEHILFQCQGTVKSRRTYWKEVRRVCPVALFIELENMTDRDKSFYIINCFNSDLIGEWSEVYQCVGKFVHNTVSEYLEE